MLGKRDSKYNAKPTVVDGLRFASKREARYYCELKLLKRAGAIKDFELQPRFELLPANDLYRAVTYVGDFLIKYNDGKEAIVDVKGVQTPVFLLKRKLMYALLGKQVVCER